jgi:ankyrin repeat protein
VSFLIKRGADISTVATKWDLNALHIACVYNQHPDVVEALIKGGLDIESKIYAGDTPLVIAAANTANLEVVQRLVELGADKNVYLSENGRTPHGIVTRRVSQRDGRMGKISDEFEVEVLKMLD